MQIQDPFKIETQNDFIDSPPFGLYDIFGDLICNTTDYDKQGLAAYKLCDDYRLFEDGYVESFRKATLSLDCGLHVYVGRVLPTIVSPAIQQVFQ